MNRFIVFSLLAAACSALVSCADHDDPQLAPIDTSRVKISASVRTTPAYTSWMNVSEELTINVSDIEMTAPKDVVLRSISLIANNGLGFGEIDNKPYSGEAMEFKVPLNALHGRVNFSLRGNLIKKNSRDAEVIIADNIQKIVFSETPEFECEGWLYVSVSSTSTSGEEYSRSFEVRSTENLTILIPDSELYWTPAAGTASTIDLTLSGGSTTWSPNTTFENTVTNIAVGTSSSDNQTLKLTLPNIPGSLNSQKLQLYVRTSYFGTWENVSIAPYNLTTVFSIAETE